MVQEAIDTRNRFNVVLSAILIWAVLLSVRLFYFSVIDREDSFSQMATESLEKGKIRAMRGRILSADGDVLAFSRRKTALHIKVDIGGSQLNNLVAILEKEMKLGRRQILMKLANSTRTDSVVIADNLSPKQIERFSRYFTRNSSVFLKMSFERIYNTKSKKVGRTLVDDGQLRGISGFEEKYNEQLQGQDLIYEAMVDRQNRVIEKTYREISKMIPGRDIHLTEEEWR